MKNLMLAILVSACAVGTAAGQGAPVPGTCESKAVANDGKPLTGAARISFMNKCKRDTAPLRGLPSDPTALARRKPAS